MKKYVLSFIWDEDYQKIILISKKRPKWQEGLYNGIGGKYEESDRTIYHAATREIKEETGLVIDEQELYQFSEIVGKNYIVYCFVCNITTAQFFEYKTLTDEEVTHGKWYDMLSSGLNECIPNLEFIVPLSKRRDYYTVFYTD